MVGSLVINYCNRGRAAAMGYIVVCQSVHNGLSRSVGLYFLSLLTWLPDSTAFVPSCMDIAFTRSTCTPASTRTLKFGRFWCLSFVVEKLELLQLHVVASEEVWPGIEASTSTAIWLYAAFIRSPSRGVNCCIIAKFCGFRGLTSNLENYVHRKFGNHGLLPVLKDSRQACLSQEHAN